MIFTSYFNIEKSLAENINICKIFVQHSKNIGMFQYRHLINVQTRIVTFTVVMGGRVENYRKTKFARDFIVTCVIICDHIIRIYYQLSDNLC